MIEKLVQVGFFLFISLGALIAVRLFIENESDKNDKTKTRGKGT